MRCPGCGFESKIALLQFIFGGMTKYIIIDYNRVSKKIYQCKKCGAHVRFKTNWGKVLVISLPILFMLSVIFSGVEELFGSTSKLFKVSSTITIMCTIFTGIFLYLIRYHTTVESVDEQNKPK